MYFATQVFLIRALRHGLFKKLVQAFRTVEKGPHSRSALCWVTHKQGLALLLRLALSIAASAG
jgi:hypothetical protein